jgi:hypothetical protein
MFEGDDLNNAMGIPFFYGLCEAVFGGIYCVGCWKAGWAKAPPNTPIWTMLFTSFEVLEAETQDIDEIEISVTQCSDGSNDKPPEKAEGNVMTTYFSFFDSEGVPVAPGSFHPKKNPSGQLSRTLSPKPLQEAPGSLA